MLKKLFEKLYNKLQDIFKKEFKAEEFGAYLRDLRESQNLSLRRVAKLGEQKGVDFSYGYVHRLEKGLIKNPDSELVRGVLSALNVDPSEITVILKRYDLL